jgi:hypothetical protein
MTLALLWPPIALYAQASYESSRDFRRGAKRGRIVERGRKRVNATPRQFAGEDEEIFIRKAGSERSGKGNGRGRKKTAECVVFDCLFAR